MSSKKSDNDNHHLFITPQVFSKAKKYYFLFKPKEIVVSQPFEFCLEIKNIGNKLFPGGVVEQLEILFSNKSRRYLDKITIPKIAKGETYTTLICNAIATDSGTAWFHLVIKPKDDKKINYYQLNRVTNEKELIEREEWTDYFHVASEQEMHQRYTNYILLGLTAITVLLIIINLGLLLR